VVLHNKYMRELSIGLMNLDGIELKSMGGDFALHLVHLAVLVLMMYGLLKLTMRDLDL
jgi:hypothetical protein